MLLNKVHETDEKIHPIQWTEQSPIGVLVGAASQCFFLFFKFPEVASQCDEHP